MATSAKRPSSAAFELRNDERIGDAAARVLSEQLDRTVEELATFESNPGTAAHNARRRFKETRALLRLLRPHLGETFSRHNERLRDSARTLASIREADAMRQNAIRLRRQIVERAGRAAYAGLLRALRRHKRVAAAAPLTAADVASVVGDLDVVRTAGASMRLARQNFSALEPGLRTTYSRARQSMKQAAAGDAEAFHEWRKHVKTHWYHMLLLRNIAPELTSGYRELLGRLSKFLGEHHDLYVLEEFLRRTRIRRRAEVVELLAALRNGVEEQAAALGRQLYAEPTSAWVSRMQRYWESTVRQEPAAKPEAVAEPERDNADDESTLASSEGEENVEERSGANEELREPSVTPSPMPGVEDGT